MLCQFRFHRANIFACLVHVSFGGFRCLGIILLDILHREEWPSHVIDCLHCLEPLGVDWISTYHIHPLYGLIGGWEIVNTVGLAHHLFGLFGICGWAAGLEWDAIAPTAATDSDGNGLVVACNQEVLF